METNAMGPYGIATVNATSRIVSLSIAIIIAVLLLILGIPGSFAS